MKRGLFSKGARRETRRKRLRRFGGGAFHFPISMRLLLVFFLQKIAEFVVIEKRLFLRKRHEGLALQTEKDFLRTPQFFLREFFLLLFHARRLP